MPELPTGRRAVAGVGASGSDAVPDDGPGNRQPWPTMQRDWTERTEVTAARTALDAVPAEFPESLSAPTGGVATAAKSASMPGADPAACGAEPGCPEYGRYILGEFSPGR